MQYQSTPPDASEPPLSLQFQQVYPAMALPPARRRVRWSRVALIAVPVLLCAAILLNMGINVWRILVVPEVHASLTVGTTATLKTSRGEIVTVTITSTNAQNPAFVNTGPLTGYALQVFSVAVQDTRAATNRTSFVWTAIGADGKIYHNFAFNGIAFASQGAITKTNTSTAPVPAISVSFQLPTGVAVRAVVCSPTYRAFGGITQSSEGRLIFDAP